MSKKYLCVHGHFYQPPRENPWLETVERQESASPFHDWNDRIHYECYLPNAMSRIFDDNGKILNIVNNYSKISFNFGPTLLSWLETERPETYQQILAADQESLKQNKGSGNAIAQVYSHMIMPLANRRDKVTQVKWGVEDFKFRFNRSPDSIWLAETACNEETIEVLAEEGIKYILLAPQQAESVRNLGQKEWHDVTGEKINPKVPYRCFLKSNPEKFIDIFFYDGPISRAIGFENILSHSQRFLERLEKAVDPKRKEPQLIHVATDGETYGHHKAYGDRVLAYLLADLAPKKGYTIVNYSQFLALHPPDKEVRLVEGDNGEGTSWSCAHGVKRWKEHCGCRGDGPSEWTQHWRKPLREALDWLRDELITLFEKEGGKYFKNVWDARNEYIHVILNRSKSSIEAFINEHANRPLEKEEINFCLRLMEMQRHAMLMYTSCGWFFSELSGIETVQILTYAARAIQLAELISGISVEDQFSSLLQKAKSNIPDLGDGKKIYQNIVKPHLVYLTNVVSYYATFSILKDFTDEEKKNFFCFALDVTDQRTETVGGVTLNFGRTKVHSKITWSEDDYIFAAVQFGPYDFRSYVNVFASREDYEKMEKDLFEGLQTLHVLELIKKVEAFFGKEHYSLKSLPLEWRTEIISNASKDIIENIHTIYEKLYEENMRVNEIYNSVRVPIPEELGYISELTLRRRLQETVQELAKHQFDPKKSKSVEPILNMAAKMGLDLNKKKLCQYLSEELAIRARILLNQTNEVTVTEAFNILLLAEKVGVDLDKSVAQDYLFLLLRKWQDFPDAIERTSHELIDHVYQLAADIGFNLKEFDKKELKKLLTPIG